MPASFVCIAVYLYYNCYKKVSDKEIKVEPVAHAIGIMFSLLR